MPAAAAICLFLFYCTAIPVKFAFMLRINGHTDFGAGLAIFEGRYALKSARSRALGMKPNLPWRKTEMELRRALPAALHAGRYLLRHTHLEKLQAAGQFSLGDAARTALAWGFIHSLQGMLLPFAPPGSLQFSLQPDFSAGGSDAWCSGMVSVPAGHIIIAALIGAWHYLKRRSDHGKASD